MSHRIESLAGQTTSHVLMIRPARFGFNELTAADNRFQQNDPALPPAEIQARAVREFDAFVAQLREASITVTVFDDTPEPHTPDAVFPNNWISFHASGRILLYPMYAANRRLERRHDIVVHFAELYPEPEKIDLSASEEEDLYLEGTGSMVLDRVNGIAYASVSPRTSPELVEEFCRLMEYRAVLFHGTDASGQPIYHTNVVMALGSEVAVVCLECIEAEAERLEVEKSLISTGHRVVEISRAQMAAFAGNMLELTDAEGNSRMVMSQRAYRSLSPEQLEQISAFARPLIVPLDVIETYGGGSVRCMLAEVFEPPV